MLPPPHPLAQQRGYILERWCAALRGTLHESSLNVMLLMSWQIGKGCQRLRGTMWLLAKPLTAMSTLRLPVHLVGRCHGQKRLVYGSQKRSIVYIRTSDPVKTGAYRATL